MAKRGEGRGLDYCYVDKVLRLVNVYTFVSSLGLVFALYMVPFYASVLGADYSELGIIGGVRGVSYTFLPALIGYFSKRLNKVALLIGGAALLSFSIWLVAASTDVQGIIVASVVMGFGIGLFWPPAETLVTEIVEGSKRVKAFSKYGIAWSLPFVIGPLVGGSLATFLGIKNLFVLSSSIVVATIPILIFTLPAYVKVKASRVSKDPVAGGTTQVSDMLRVYSIVMPYGFIMAAVVTIFPGYVRVLGIGEFELGILFTVFGLSRFLTFMVMTKVSKASERLMVTMTFSLISLSFIMLAIFPSLAWFMVSMMILGIALAIYYPVTISFVSRSFSTISGSFAVGLYETIFGIGFLTGPLVSGYLADYVGISMQYVILSLVGLAMIILSRVWVFKG